MFIEVEKKCLLTEQSLKAIESTATLIGNETFSDVYYDTMDFRLTRNDIWLRERNCRFELKIGMKNSHVKQMDHYLEIQDPEEILKWIGLEKEKILARALKQAEILPFASIQTIRRKYRWHQVKIDLDLAYFDDFIYRIAEFEIQVDNQDRIEEAEKEILNCIRFFGLNPDHPIRAKLIEYIYQKSPLHLQALIDAHVVPIEVNACLS